MNAARMLDYLSWFLLLSGVALMGLHYIKVKTYWLILTIVNTFQAVSSGMERSFGSCVVNWLFASAAYWLWKNAPDDDDRPRKKRAALKSKFDKVIPKPVDTPVYNPV